jgi:predicted transcriptional regulator
VFKHGQQKFLSSFKSAEASNSFIDELSLKWHSSQRLKVKTKAKVQLAGEIQIVEEGSQTLLLIK